MSSQHALLLLGSSISSIPPSRYLRSLKLPPQRSAAVGFGGRNRISGWLGSQKAAAGFGETTEEVMELERKVLAQTYARAPVVLVRGKGCSGFCSIPEVKLAKCLVECSFADCVFFSNSGIEANKVAIEFARKFQIFSRPDVKLPATEFIAFTNSFHVRTLGSLVLTSKENYRSPFEPVMPGVTFMEYGNIEMVKYAIQPGKIVAVFVELVQGEGGIYSQTKEFL
ncbi:hypothetical protein MRB53_018726 [Persea americana]|uniref:Uncharacterized protein n=1 Tax=Persea americana TaxID=3435 RepID=A0ACC2MA45_PERAE|nr:hypothetical protein MRB53_018726 [Persea americana]